MLWPPPPMTNTRPSGRSVRGGATALQASVRLSLAAATPERVNAFRDPDEHVVRVWDTQRVRDHPAPGARGRPEAEGGESPPWARRGHGRALRCQAEVARTARSAGDRPGDYDGVADGDVGYL